MSKSADAFRTISEVADWLGIPAHVLRFWESKFTQVKPVKRAGGRRYYRPADMQLLGGIRKLLHDEGMTIKGVQKIMREQGVKHVMALSPPMDIDDSLGMDEITLEVAPEAEEERGQVLSFGRSGGEKPTERAVRKPEPVSEPDLEPEAAADEMQDATAPIEDEPAPEPVPETTPSSEPDRTLAKDVPEVDSADNAPESPPAEAATPEEPKHQDPPVLPSARPITTPDDPPDTITAPAGTLTALAGLSAPVSPSKADALSALASRLRDLRVPGSTGTTP
ncbi:MerR family transcriptional regulator [Roseovarius sp. LXJ103]|uniref:MerR family transcriptional regulator n=1 Tax=Roseovarius carneus TaxID=2853164 RepID=UPI000D6049A7|nr:MerR family transcriptional regulator [Roseovarius carneus]MBZ8119259.1 MerR family transcriptional regulator [Roseovarius carneus]PWE35118.1 MerR family transcriptional regulator [Pelagicola sp. LXJ1103]